MDRAIEHLARDSGVSEVVDLRRHDVGPALESFAALVAERCALIAYSVSLEQHAARHKPTPEETGAQIADAIKAAFPMSIGRQP